MNEQFETVITSKKSWFNFNFKELWRYRDLIFLFVKRTFVSQYKQTILGPAWAIIQPFFTTVVFTVVFGNLAGLAPGGVPTFVFYLSGSILWGYFSGCLTNTANTFTNNSHILGKVYFPRLAMPISTVFSQLISFVIQYTFFILFWVYYLITSDNLRPNLWILATPFMLLHLAMLSLGVGIIISAATTKYRDLKMAVGFCVQLWMYATPIAYDIGIVPESLMGLYMLNPVTPIVMMFRYAYLGIGQLYLTEYVISLVISVIMLLLGMMLFNRVEKTFMDTV